jgi:cell cycle sensor histidine kinase DivJ|nr:HAMP domain-containing sensor histidine kinase [uncultured Hyphomonas sp.]
MLPQKQRQRLQIIHLGWLAMVAAVAGSVLVSREREALSFAWLGLAALPGLAGFFLLGRDRLLNQFAPSFLVITWTVFAAFTLALSGAAMSPLAVLFVIAPLVALNLGNTAMAAEASIFGAGAYFAAILLSEIGILPSGEAVTGFSGVARLLAFAALVTFALLVWYLARGQEELAAASAEVAPVEVSHPAKATIPVPADSGVLLLDVTPDGMIRGADGDRLGLPGIGAGTLLRDVLDASATPASLMATTAQAGETHLVNGRTVAFCATPYDGGTHIALIDRPKQVAKTEPGNAEAKAREAVRQRTAFFASLGHDLKTPLNAIIGYADMMRHGVRGPLPEAYQDYPAIIHDSGQELLLMVEDMLDLARADADRQRLEPEPVDLAASAQSVIRQLDNQAERAGVKLRLKAEDDVWAQADARAVRQIWQNLVSNAIKYSENGSAVVLEAVIEGNAAVLSVTDKGAGMSEEDVRLALEPFSQGGNARGVKGTGLGLAVVKRFAELHGGQIDIRSAPGKGTRVSVTLPRANDEDLE